VVYPAAHPGARRARSPEVPQLPDPSHLRLRTASPLPVYVAIGVAITAAGSLYVRHSQQELQLNVERELSSIADATVAQLVGWRDAVASGWGGFRTNDFVTDELRVALADRDPELLARTARVLERKRQKEGADAALLVDGSGSVVAATPGASPPTARDLALARAALEAEGPRLDDGERVGIPSPSRCPGPAARPSAAWCSPATTWRGRSRPSSSGGPTARGRPSRCWSGATATSWPP
jgi:hypothetical protein